MAAICGLRNVGEVRRFQTLTVKSPRCCGFCFWIFEISAVRPMLARCHH